MAATLARVLGRRAVERSAWPRTTTRSAGLAALTTATVVVVVAVWGNAPAGSLAWVGLAATWGVAGAALAWRGDVRLGGIAVSFPVLAGLAAVTAADGGDASALAHALAIALLPAAAMHFVLALPTGAPASRRPALGVVVGYALAAGLGVLLWSSRPSLPAWPVVIESALAVWIGVDGASARYRSTQGRERRRMHRLALAIAVGAEVVLVGMSLHALVGWPPHVLAVVGAATTPLPLALLLEPWTRMESRLDDLLMRSLSLVALTTVILAVYLVVVLGLGREPTDRQGTLLVLSMVAAAIAAMLYAPARDRLRVSANRLLYGAREAPEEVVRSFGARLSRSVPLEELLRQLAESLRGTLSLDAAEVWTGSGGTLERVVSEPDRGPASLRLAAPEASVLARAGVSGRAWTAVWLPQLLEDRGDVHLRIAPITQTGELFGLLIAERPADGEPFQEEEERVLHELAHQVGLALRNVRLDSELQASLEQLRRSADELAASRRRVVAAADAERRRIERDLHDGAQQYLVGMAIQLRLARELADRAPHRVKPMLDELSAAVQEAQHGLRDLAHGIYPPLLQDQGLAAALAAAAGRMSIPARVHAGGARRYAPDVEATVYFCCLEALQNAAKHAGRGGRATLRVWEEEGGLLFEVADDGAGFIVGRGGAGLTNMRDRLGAIGGSLRVESEPGHGTKVVGAIPLER